MQNHGLGAMILALALSILLASSAAADIVDLSNGARLPKKKSYDTEHGTYPTDEDLKNSGRNNLKLAYDAFEIGGTRGDAAQVANVYITAVTQNVDFQAGDMHGARGYWKEAAQAFETAAESLNGAAKQVALYKGMLAAANTGKPALTIRLSEKLLASDPKTYYFGPAQERLARVYAIAGRIGEAVAVLKKVTDAPGMNVRDYFNAAYLSAWLTQYVRATKPEHFMSAEEKFRALLTELERHPRRELADIPKLKIMMSLAASVRALGRSEEAKKLFQDVLKATTENTDKTVLAGVYYGLGDVAFEEASELSKQLKANPAVAKKVDEMLHTAALHYLRVLLLYRDYAEAREIFGSTQGVARVFSAQFSLGGEKDCELARKSYSYYRQAVDLQRTGEARRLLIREGKALKNRIDSLCKDGADEEAKDGGTEEDK